MQDERVAAWEQLVKPTERVRTPLCQGWLLCQSEVTPQVTSGIMRSYAGLRRPTVHPGPFVGVSQKSIFKRPCQFLALNAHQMAPRTRRWLQERGRDTPPKGLLWYIERYKDTYLTTTRWSTQGPSNPQSKVIFEDFVNFWR